VDAASPEETRRRRREGTGGTSGSVNQVMQQVDRCTEITRNLLDFARKRDPVIRRWRSTGLLKI